jgi:hypothetical protein
MGNVTLWQTHYANSVDDALRITNNIVSLYKDYGWDIDVDARNMHRIVVTSIKHNGTKKMDIVLC